MTTIITRLFPDEAAAQSAVDRLIFKGIPKRECEIVLGGDHVETRLADAQVHATAIEAYRKKLEAGHAAVVVRTTYKPLGAARLTREILDQRETIDAGDVTNDFFVRSKPQKATSVLKDHPHFLSLPGIASPGLITGGMGLPMLSDRGAGRSLMRGDKRMSQLFWPMPLISRKRRSLSIIPGGRQMSKAFWPMRLVSTKPRRKSVIPGGGFPLSRLLGLRTTI